jgi:formate dehydrogenase subunit gamma
VSAPIVAKEDTLPAEPLEVPRYNLFERIVHWEVTITFVALMLSGMALAYPRLAWLSALLGGGQTMRASHPWIGIAFTVGVLAMLIIWVKPMLIERGDREWVRRLRVYTRDGHNGLDTGRFNAGQKGYFWFVVVFSVVLFLTGLPLWFPSLLGASGRQWARLLHHISYLLMVAGFIIHVYMSTTFLPGTMSAMTTGKVTRRWAAWHHPRWYREQASVDEQTSHNEQTSDDQ